ncbi:MAG: hypothetical protein A2Y25_08875 [Candidatus Melainabacteria bacterium GWF2_37_15]|nr:MAG: hypothetical protein A2Y25_08875 [Candidatus Melainabacteria bacterium GWF2_37_15]
MTDKLPSKPHNPLVFFEDIEDLEAYINVCIEEYLETGDFQELGKSLETLIKAQGKISTFSKRAEITRQHLHALFKSKKEPKFHTMLKIFNELGFSINISREHKKAS